MKNIISFMILLCSVIINVNAAELSSLTWAKVCTGGMGEQWYGSDEAKGIADIVVDVQKYSGGWAKNHELHKLSSAELAALKSGRDEHSCLDNTATTQEMRFLAKVWKKTGEEKYRQSFLKALNMIFDAEKDCGGWSQYWPLKDDSGYQDYITFNDDLVTNVLKLLNDIKSEKNDFVGIIDADTLNKCANSFDKCIDMIIKCQIDDNGVKAAWCAQHDPKDFLPAEGRPHELPSVSGSESASLLSFLMTIPNPSVELQNTITSAVEWLDSHKIENKAIEDFTNEAGKPDRRIVDKSGTHIWGRFIQIGGESGRTVYEKFFNKLKNRGKSRSYTYQGKTYTYTEEELARSNYREDKAYQPIFAIYTDDYPHLFYRFLYNYEDTDPVPDEKGLPIATSLSAERRSSYQYLGSWCQKVIEEEYPAWKRKIELGSNDEAYTLSGETYSGSSDDELTYMFSNGFSVSNTSGKKYGGGKSSTIKYSANVEYNISIPNGVRVGKVEFYGYDNYDVDAYLKQLNGVEYSSSEYVFPAKSDTPQYVSHTIDLSGNPVSGNLRFSIGAKQCCLIITLHCVSNSGIEEIKITPKTKTVKFIKDGRILISKDGKTYNLSGHRIK